MAPSEGCGGDPAAREGPTSVTRSSRSGRMGPTITRYFGDRPAAAPTAGECDADGVEEEAVARRGCYPNPAPRRPTPAAPTAGEGESRWLGKRVALEETSAVPRCARYRRPRPFGEGTSAAGAEEAVLTCGGYGDAAPRRPTPVGAGIGIPTPAASCIPVPSGGRGGGGGRGLMDSHDYHGTSSPPAFNLAPTSDLAPKDKITAEMECMEEGYLAKTVQGYAAKAIKAGEVICVIVEEDYKPSAADAPAATSESKATPEPAVPKVEEKVPANDNNEVQLSNVKGTGPDGRILKADIEDYLASVGKGGKSKSFAASGLDYTDIPNAQIRKDKATVDMECMEEDFVCSDRGDCFGSKNGKSNYISKMNCYLLADCVSDINPISDREARSCHSRYEVLKERCCNLAEVPTLQSTCASIKISGVDIVTQIFMDICGSTISLQENLSKLDINLLSEVAFVRSGIKPRDFYSTCAGKVLEPNRLLSCYQIPRDSTIKLNARLRGGCAGHNWDDVISDLDRYRRVPLPGDLLLPEQAIIHPQVEVKYLARLLQVRCRKVLIYLCRKHYSGHSFGGNFSSQQIMFDSDGNVRIHAAPEQYSQPSALLDYNVVSGIFDRALGVAADKHPTDFFHLIHFLSVDGPTVDCQSKAVIAFVTNHISLLTYSERINHSAFLDLLITRLGADDLAALKKILVPFDWDLTLRQIPAMNQTYTYIWWKDEDGIIRYPYKNHGVSLLRFSHNFFKHRFGFTLDELEAAFSLVTSDKNFLAHLLFKILIRLKNKCQQPCPASVETFIDEVIEMLGDHTVDCEMVQGN